MNKAVKKSLIRRFVFVDRVVDKLIQPPSDVIQFTRVKLLDRGFPLPIAQYCQHFFDGYTSLRSQNGVSTRFPEDSLKPSTQQGIFREECRRFAVCENALESWHTKISGRTSAHHNHYLWQLLISHDTGCCTTRTFSKLGKQSVKAASSFLSALLELLTRQRCRKQSRGLDILAPLPTTEGPWFVFRAEHQED